MKIAVIGGGSIGLLFSYYLGREHHVTVYTRTKEQAESIRENGIRLVKKGCEFFAKTDAYPVDEWTGIEDLTIIAVKQYQLKELLESAAGRMSQAASLLFLQNGMGHVRWLADLAVKNIYIGSVEHGALALDDHSVSHNGIGATKIAVYKGTVEPLSALKTLGILDFPLEIADDYKRILVGKLVINAVINPLTAAFGVENGELMSNPHYYKISEMLFAEVAEVLKLENRALQLENIISVCKRTATNRSSMLKDVEAGRRTEIDGILGYILEEAQREKIDTPIIRTYFHHIKGEEMQRRTRD
ncbi:2-dehydropantoate 2-reductase [Bacillus massilinigeriensis]|uniref:2-dehydropantoate 2-reductase n=1 Tax=Bacillus mediterraneensis TaxID=1805474 RepID=UPI0008F8F4FF|nr:2-dehydropantoate 2-reductase [Bacillus mediterraneensis]